MITYLFNNVIRIFLCHYRVYPYVFIFIRMQGTYEFVPTCVYDFINEEAKECARYYMLVSFTLKNISLHIENITS